MRDLLLVNIFGCGVLTVICQAVLWMNLLPTYHTPILGVGVGAGIITIVCALAYKLSR